MSYIWNIYRILNVKIKKKKKKKTRYISIIYNVIYDNVLRSVRFNSIIIILLSRRIIRDILETYSFYKKKTLIDF